MNDETLSWETIHIEPIFELVSGHLHWLDGCIGRCNGYREISSKQWYETNCEEKAEKKKGLWSLGR